MAQIEKLSGRRKRGNSPYCCPICSGSYDDWMKRIDRKRDRREGKKEIRKQLGE